MTLKRCDFCLELDYRYAFDLLMKEPILVMPYFIKPFTLDVDCSTCNVGAIWSQR
jgi:hypothetical protein